MFAIRARRKVASERDFLDAVEKVVRQGTKFSSTCVFCSCFIADVLTNSNLIDHYIKYTIRPMAAFVNFIVWTVGIRFACQHSINTNTSYLSLLLRHLSRKSGDAMVERWSSQIRPYLAKRL
jgi:hypothetical protein